MEERILRSKLDIERYLPYLFSLLFVLGFLQLLDALRVVYYPLLHRATRIVRFELGVSLVWPLLLLLGLWTAWVMMERDLKLLLFPVAALVALPFLGLEASISIASIQAVVAGIWSKKDYREFLFSVLLLLCGVEGLALLHWIVFVPLGWASPLEGVANVEAGLFYLAAYLVPLLILPLLFMWVLKPLVRWGLGREVYVARVRSGVDGVRWSRLLLVFSIVLGVVASLYPYGPSVNPDGRAVGVDYKFHVEWMEIVQDNPLRAFNIGGGPRPLIIIILNAFRQVTGLDASESVKYSPILLIPLLTISAYFLAKETLDDVRYGAWAAFFTVCGVQVTVGMYSFFLTNWLGLSIEFFSLGFLFRALRKKNNFDISVASVLGGLLVFTHPWTFTQYLITTVVISVLYWYRTRPRGLHDDEMKTLITYIACMALAELLKIYIFGGVGGISASSTAIKGSSSFLNFWWNSIFSFRLLYGGTLAMALIWGLCVAGVLILKEENISELFFLIFLVLSSLLFLVGDDTIKSRLVFNIPVGFLSSCGFLYFQNTIRLNKIRYIFSFYIITSTITYLFRTLANIV